MATRIEAMTTGPAPASAAEIGDLLDLLDRAEAEGRDDNSLQQQARDAVQDLALAAKAGDERALPALRVLIDRRPESFTIRRFGDAAIQEAAKLAASDGDLLNREMIARQIAGMREELAGPGASALERALAERVALAWYDAHRVEIGYAAQEASGAPSEKAEFLSRQRTRAQSRFLAAAKSLATVRRLALPVLHVHATGAAPTGPGAAGDRLRVLACDPD